VESLEVAIERLRVRGQVHEPLGQPARLDGGAAPPAGAALDLHRRQRRRAGGAPRKLGLAPLDEPALEQLQKSHCVQR
jgi:hypothetical protein